MMTRESSRTAMIWGLWFLAAGIFPLESRAADDPAAQAFVEQLVSAINGNDDGARRALMHPDAMRCERATRQTMAAGAFQQRQGPIPPGYRWEIAPMPAGSPGWFAEKFDYPVRPTHQLHIDFETGLNRSTGIMLQLVKQGNEWREVTGCPKADTVAEATQAAKARAQQDQRIARLAAAVNPRLKAEVLAHAAAGRKVDAILQYRNATSEDLAIAKGVVERLIEASQSEQGPRGR